MPPDPLAQLRDVHLPPPVAFWPPAPGWWILGGLGVLLLAALALGLWRWWQRGAPRRAALRELKHLETQSLSDTERLQQVSQLLRRLVRLQQEAGAAALSGEAWLQYLDQQSRGNLFTQGPGRLLAEGPFQARVQEPVEPAVDAARAWIQAWKPKPRGPEEAGGPNAAGVLAASPRVLPPAQTEGA